MNLVIYYLFKPHCSHLVQVCTEFQEKYEKEVKDARARELMYAEEAAILDKVFGYL